MLNEFAYFFLYTAHFLLSLVVGLETKITLIMARFGMIYHTQVITTILHFLSCRASLIYENGSIDDVTSILSNLVMHSFVFSLLKSIMCAQIRLGFHFCN